MRRIATLAVVGLALIMTLAATGTAQGQQADEGKTKMTSAKESRWHGIIIRMNKDDSTLTVRRQNIERKVHYDGTTKWTRLNKPADMADFKEGADVICLGTYDKKGNLHATRIDLRRE